MFWDELYPMKETKEIHVIKKGCTSTQSFNNSISYHQEDCLTIFGVLGIKVWIIY